MTEFFNLPIILIAALLAAASPGPSTLAIASTSMSSGRKHGLALAAGITTGSLTWSLTAAFGLSAIMFANVWMLEAARYLGATYLIYLAYKSAKSAITKNTKALEIASSRTYKQAYMNGLLLHLTNPKAVLFFGSLYAIGVPPNATQSSILIIVAALFVQSALVFHGYAVLFSSKPMVDTYLKLRRWFEGVFAICFAAAGLKILTTRLS